VNINSIDKEYWDLFLTESTIINTICLQLQAIHVNEKQVDLWVETAKQIFIQIALFINPQASLEISLQLIG
jgi:riboflavin synthase alpha subunit